MPVRPYEPRPLLPSVRPSLSAGSALLHPGCSSVQQSLQVACRSLQMPASPVSCPLTALPPRDHQDDDTKIKTSKVNKHVDDENTSNTQSILIAIASFCIVSFISTSSLPVSHSSPCARASQLWMPVQRSRRTDTLFFFYLICSYFYFNVAPKYVPIFILSYLFLFFAFYRTVYFKNVSLKVMMSNSFSLNKIKIVFSFLVHTLFRLPTETLADRNY